MGSGCFWGREYHLRQLPGVISTRTGFAGGTVINPTYQEVCAGGTGHAEVVEVIYDLRKLPTEVLLAEFFLLHEFAKDRRSGNGQYRSVIFVRPESFHASKQASIALEMMDTLRANGYPPSTELKREANFFPADSRHQQYCSSRGILPKKRQSEKIREILTLYLGTNFP